MRIVVAGASGFIGDHLTTALFARSHEVVGVSRKRPHAADHPWFEIDAAHANVEDWRKALKGADVVINTIGIFRETTGQRFQDLHVQAAKNLFLACRDEGVGRVIQLSALGADNAAASAYHLSKRDADNFLLTLDLDATVVQPSLVFAEGSESAKVFLAWASLPVLPLPAGGDQPIQPIHIDDLVQSIVLLVEQCNGPFSRRRGPSPCRARADHVARIPTSTASRIGPF